MRNASILITLFSILIIATIASADSGIGKTINDLAGSTRHRSSVSDTQGYDFSYSYKNPGSSEADDYIVGVSNAVLYSEGTVRAWKQDVGSSTFESGTPGVITYRFEFQKTVAEAQLFISTTTFNWSYSEGHSFIYGSRDGVNWVELAEALPPEYGGANTQRAQSVPESLLGGTSLWFKVELYSYGESAPEGGLWTNTAQHSRYDEVADNTTFSLDVNFADSPPERLQCADYDVTSNTAEVNCVTVGDTAYSAELSLYSYDPPLFELSGIDMYTGGSVGPDCAEFDTESLVLYMPCLSVGGEGFTAGLELTSADPVLFGVRDAVDMGDLSGMVLTNLYVNENSSDPLVATFADINGRYYAIYGVKDGNNVPLYYDRLVTYTMDADGVLDEYLTMDFDAQGRPTAFRLPGEEGDAVIDYLSSATARITVTSEGTSESVDATNPFGWLAEASSAYRAPKDSRPFEGTSEIIYVGDIVTCATGTPKVTVQRNFDSKLKNKYPFLARSFDASVSANTYDDDVDYSYIYKFTIPGDDFDAWSASCKKGYFFNTSLGFIGVWKDRVGDFITGVKSVFQDYKEGSLSNSKRAVADKLTDTATGGVPLISVARNINDAWGVEGSGINGPCSRTAYDFKRKRLLQEETITVDDGSGHVMKKTYQPTASWIEGAGFTQSAPSFDFSDQCGETEPVTCESVVAAAEVVTEELCVEAGGVWWPPVDGLPGECWCPVSF